MFGPDPCHNAVLRFRCLLPRGLVGGTDAQEVFGRQLKNGVSTVGYGSDRVEPPSQVPRNVSANGITGMWKFGQFGSWATIREGDLLGCGSDSIS